MRVFDTFMTKGLGPIATTKSDGPCPLSGSRVRRISDGQVWTVNGVERSGGLLGTAGKAGEPIGLLLKADNNAEAVRGDELERET